MAIYLSLHIYHDPRDRLEWFDGQGDNPLPAKSLNLGSLGTVEAVLAHTAEARRGLAAAANGFRAEAMGRLAAHRDKGNSSIDMEGPSTGRALDYIVYLHDPKTKENSGKPRDRTQKRSALSMEFGYTHWKSGKHVAGLGILTGTSKAMGRNRGRKW